MVRGRGEAGVATVLTAALCGVLLLVAMVAGGLVAVVAAHRTAQAGADLAALAGARAVQDGDDPCGTAAEIARRNRTVLEDCSVRGFEVTVRVGVETRLLPGGAATMRARSRAGPTSALEPG